jgi:hypothetical protein
MQLKIKLGIQRKSYKIGAIPGLPSLIPEAETKIYAIKEKKHIKKRFNTKY